LKAESDVPLRTIGSLSVAQQLITAGVVDRLRLMTFPCSLGTPAASRPSRTWHPPTWNWSTTASWTAGCSWSRTDRPAKTSREPEQPKSDSPTSKAAEEERAPMVIVAGHITVEPQQRESYLADCVSVVEQARGTAGCLDFAITADLIDPGRVNIFERWESQAAVESFRSSGPSNEQGAAMLSASVTEYDITDVRPLFGEGTA
jgi:quinol monooxygenase YgiN